MGEKHTRFERQVLEGVLPDVMPRLIALMRLEKEDVIDCGSDDDDDDDDDDVLACGDVDEERDRDESDAGSWTLRKAAASSVDVLAMGLGDNPRCVLLF